MLTLLVLAGWSQLALAAASLAIPRVLGWPEETANLRPLTRCVFWVYAGYVWSAHVLFGVASAFAPAHILEGTPLSRGVAGFIAAWWGARVAIQFTLFRRHRSPGMWFFAAEAALATLFLALAILYGLIALRVGP